MRKPEKSEYNSYFELYIGKLAEGDIIETLSAQLGEFTQFLYAIGEEGAGHRYAPGKWSVKEVLGHIVDCERIFGARALAIARGERTPLPSFDQDSYVKEGNFDDRTLADLQEEFSKLRRSHLAMFATFDEKAWERKGKAGGNDVTVKAIAWIIAGHLHHHAGVLAERYL